MVATIMVVSYVARQAWEGIRELVARRSALRTSRMSESRKSPM